MPNIKSQKDRVVQAAAEQAHNKAIKTNLKTVVKKADAAIDANAADKDATVLAAVSAIDKARAKGVIKRTPPAARSAVWQSVLTRTLDRFLIDEQNLCTGFPAQGFCFARFSGHGSRPLKIAQGGKIEPRCLLQKLLRRQAVGRLGQQRPRSPCRGHRRRKGQPRQRQCRACMERTARRQGCHRAQGLCSPKLP